MSMSRLWVADERLYPPPPLLTPQDSQAFLFSSVSVFIFLRVFKLTANHFIKYIVFNVKMT